MCCYGLCKTLKALQRNARCFCLRTILSERLKKRFNRAHLWLRVNHALRNLGTKISSYFLFYFLFATMLCNFTLICDDVMQFYSDLRKCYAVLLLIATMLCNFTLNRDNVMQFTRIHSNVTQFYSDLRQCYTILLWFATMFCNFTLICDNVLQFYSDLRRCYAFFSDSRHCFTNLLYESWSKIELGMAKNLVMCTLQIN